MEKTIKKHLLPLWNLLPYLEEKNQSHAFWVKLEKALRDYLLYDLGGVDADAEDAFQNMLIQIYKNPAKYTAREEPTLQDGFFQRISLLRLTFSTHMMRVHRKDVQEEVRMLEYKARKFGLTAEEEQNLKDLKALKKKL